MRSEHRVGGGGDEEKAARTGGREVAFEQGSDVMLDVVPRDNAGTRLAGAVEDFDLLLSQGRAGLGEVSAVFFGEAVVDQHLSHESSTDGSKCGLSVRSYICPRSRNACG